MSDERIAKNKRVYFTYEITNEHDEIVERVDVPVSYVHGTQAGILEKVEQALEGHVAGDEVTVALSPEESFGLRDESLIFTDDIKNVPERFRRIGAEVEMKNELGEARQFRVSKIENGRLTLDGNHPLAGKSIKFKIQISTIRDAMPDEIELGRSGDSPTMH